MSRRNLSSPLFAVAVTLAIAAFAINFATPCVAMLDDSGAGVLDGDVQYVRLGFILPSPEERIGITKRLADEWISAARVALDVLSPRYHSSFVVVPFVEVLPCDSEAAKLAAERLVYLNVVGVVGPGCSEAVKGANSVLQPAGVPFVSFSATADVFNTQEYNTFFRTVFADKHQAKDMVSLIKFFQFEDVHLFHSAEIYGSSLAKDIKALIGSSLPVNLIPIQYPLGENETVFANLAVTERSVCVFVALPAVAEGLWRAAEREGFTKYPWWYLGSDGVASLDFVDQSNEKLGTLSRSVQGEIAVGPNVPSDTSTLQPFLDYWREHKEYQGLVTTTNYLEPRMYVPHLIDAVWAYFEAFSNIVTKQGRQVTSAALLECFRDKPANCVRFTGTSGTVAFNKVTGERLKLDKVPAYSLYNLVGKTWKEKSKWVLNGTYGVTLIDPTDKVYRPGPLPQGSLLPLQHQVEAP